MDLKTDYEQAKKCFAYLRNCSDPAWRKRGQEQYEKTVNKQGKEQEEVAETALEGFFAFLGLETDD